MEIAIMKDIDTNN